MSRVIVLDRVSVDISSLENVVQFNRYDASPFQTERFEEDLLAKMEDIAFDPERDRVAIVGRIVTVVLGVAALLRRYRKLRVLVYYAPDEVYMERTLEIDRTL